MASIILDLDSDLTTSTYHLTINPTPTSSLTLKSDGLYVPASKGVNGISNPGFKDGVYDGIVIKQSHVSVDSTVHRCYEATDSTGTTLVNFNKDSDNLYPGDMYYVITDNTRSYYLITNVISYGGDINTVSSSILLGSW